MRTVLAKHGRERHTAARLLLAGASAVLALSLAREPGFRGTDEMVAAVFLAGLWGADLLLAHWGGYDKWLLPLAGTCNALGLALSFRLDPGGFYRQTVYSLLGLFLLLAVVRTARACPAWPAAYRWTSYATMGVLLLTVLAGRQVNGARSWLFVGGLGFEPSGPALVFLTLTVGMVLWHGVREIWLVAAAAVLLAATHNLGAILTLALVLTGSAYLRGWRWGSLIAAGVCLLGLAALFYLVFPVVPARLALWLAPAAEPGGPGFQMIRAFRAFAEGGLWGRGFASGRPGSIPAAGSDFVFAAWAGIAGAWMAWLILALYLFYLYRGLKAKAVTFPDATLSARALALLITCQAFLLAGGNTGFFPLTGVPMPFLSRGGSALAGSYLATGMILSLGPPGTLGRRERRLLLGVSAVAGMLALAALWRSLGSG